MRNARTKSIVSAAMAVAAIAASPASASVYTANFDGPTLDSSLGFNASGGDLIVGFGSATLNYFNHGQAATYNPQIYTNFTLAGDYLAQVTVNFATLPGNTSTQYADFNLLASQAGSYSAIGGLNTPNATVKSYYSNPAITETGRTEVSQPVVLRIQRVGDTVTQSFADLGSPNFVTLGSFSGAEFLGATRISLAEFFTGSTFTAGTVAFHDFTITVPDVASTVPEAGTWAMLMLGFGMIGGGARYRRRTRTIAHA